MHNKTSRMSCRAAEKHSRQIDRTIFRYRHSASHFGTHGGRENNARGNLLRVMHCLRALWFILFNRYRVAR